MFGQLFKDLELNSSPFLWDFLGHLFSEPSGVKNCCIFDYVCMHVCEEINGYKEAIDLPD